MVVVMPKYLGSGYCPNVGAVSQTPQLWGYGVVVG